MLYVGEDKYKIYIGSSAVKPVVSLSPYTSQVEYLESTGTQYINTNYFPNNTTKAECGFLVANINNTAVFGSRDGNMGTKDFDVIAYDKSSYGLIARFNGQNQTSKKLSNNTYYEFSMESGKFVLNGTIFSKYKPSAFQASVNTLTLFARHLNSSGDLVYGSTRIYYFKIYDNGNMILNLVPVRVGNIGCMYDKISNQLFTNSGTGNFTIGPDV